MAESAHATLTAGRNGVWALEDRQIFANELRSMQQSAVDALNANFDSKFLFGGSSTKNLPFELKDGVLTFRGLDVTDPRNQAQLHIYSQEKIYVDMGFGLTVDVVNEKPVVRDNSAFNTSIPGINIVGFGVKPEDNFILNLGLIADALEEEPLDYELTSHYWEKLTDQRMKILGEVTKVGANYNFLVQQRTVLEISSDNLNEKILNVEFMDLEETIMSMKMHDYIYRAALEMGSRILTPSFIDFMR